MTRTVSSTFAHRAVAPALVAAIFTLVSASAGAGPGGGGNRGGGGGHASGGNHTPTRTSINSNTSNRNTNVNKNTNVNQNVNVNKNVNVNVNNNVHGGYYGPPGGYYGPPTVGVGAVVAGVATAVVIGAVVASLPPSCSTVVIGGVAYHNCGGTYYQPQYTNGNVAYVVVAPPRY